jgi:hypothetical protein
VFQWAPIPPSHDRSLSQKADKLHIELAGDLTILTQSASIVPPQIPGYDFFLPDLPIPPVPVPYSIINYHNPRTISPGNLQLGPEVLYENLPIASIAVAEVRRYES